MKLFSKALLLALAFSGVADAFVPQSPKPLSALQLNAAPAQDVWILPSEDEVAKAVHQIVERAAEKAIAERGYFALAIPGGSVLKVSGQIVLLVSTISLLITRNVSTTGSFLYGSWGLGFQNNTGLCQSQVCPQ